MDRWRGKLALVTGASTGIGAAICKELVKHGVKVVGVARDLEKLEELSKECSAANGGVLYPIRCDLTKDEEVYHVFDEIKSKYGSLIICINNAGMSVAKPILDGSPDEWRAVLDLNVVALCLCSKLAINTMLAEEDSGHIINISSMNGYRLTSSIDNFYASSKFAVRAIAQGLRQELRDKKSHIRVTSISPGMINTEFHLRSFGGDEEKAKDIVSYEMLEAEDIAEAVLYALSAHPRVDVNDILMRPTEQIT